MRSHGWLSYSVIFIMNHTAKVMTQMAQSVGDSEIQQPNQMLRKHY